MKIVQLEPIGIKHKKQEQVQKKFHEMGHELVFYNEKPVSVEESIERCKDAEIIIISNMKVPQEFLEQCSRLKMLSVAFAGVDHVDMDYCKKNNILVANAADYSTYSVAELTIGLIISLYRKFRWSEEQLRDSSDRQGFLGTELYGKTIGIIGLGRIGKKVAEYANVMGCKVLSYNRSEKNIEGVEMVSLNNLVERSDIVSVHVPLTPETKGLIGAEKIDKMKPEAVLINTARGPIVDYRYLAEALGKGQIKGAAIDVYEKEPPIDNNHPLLKAPNTILLPHVGFATEEAIEKRGEIVIQNILAWLDGKPINMV